MTTYLGSFQNTVPLKSQNWTDFMARHPRYANGAWNWVTQCEKRSKKKQQSFLLPFFLQRRAETFCQYAGTAWVLNFQSNQVKHTCAFDTKTAISHIQSGWHFAANQRVAIHGCEKCRYLWSVRKKPPCHLIRFWQHVHDQNVCYWIICSN